MNFLLKNSCFEIGFSKVKKNFIFCLGSASPRKNFHRIIKTFLSFVMENHIKDLILVVCGYNSLELVEEIKKESIDWNDANESVVFPTGYINDEEKIILYQNALCFIYTSQYEGFGLPPLEAMQCGCPVITSNNSSLPEVVGDAALTIDWDNDDQHIEAYQKIYTDSVYRKELKEKGLKQAKKFSWEKTVAQIESTINEKVNLFNVRGSD